MKLQSEEVVMPNLSSENQRQENNVTYIDSNEGEVQKVDTLSDSSYSSIYNDATMLAKFLERPLRIASYSWNEGAHIDEEFKPWDLFFNASSVKNKLNNFPFLNCKLHVKVMINASPFYYGAAIMAYTPLTAFNGEVIDSLVPANSSSRLSSLSTRPKIMIYPQTNQGGELELPFFYHKNWLSVNTRQDFLDMGKCNLQSFVPLQSASASPGSGVTISIYAWATEVNLTGATTAAALQSFEVVSYNEVSPELPVNVVGDVFRAAMCGLDPPLQNPIEDNMYNIISSYYKLPKRMRKRLSNFASMLVKHEIIVDQAPLQAKDEYQQNDGAISGPASAVAKVASSLGNVPYIGPYAKATSMVASAVGSVAKLFGFTNVPVLSDSQPMKPNAFYNFASPEISQPVEKLVVDPKNELSIDPCTVGIPAHDELNLNNLLSREAYFTFFTWASTKVTDDSLFTAYISPHFVNSNTYTVGEAVQTSVQGTPQSHVAAMFGNWRGDMIIRMRFICSKFHRGRAIIQWDPIADVSLTANVSNVVYTTIVDISEQTDVELRIPYQQIREWQQTPIYANSTNFDNSYFGPGSSAAIGPAYNSSIHNGYLSVKCLTTLTSPISTSDIQVLVSAKCAENLEFANPISLPDYVDYYRLQSEETITPVAVPMGEVSKTDPNSHLVYMGEKIVSLRQILRRTSLLWSRCLDADTTSSLYLARTAHTYFPMYKGFDSDGKDRVQSLDTGASTPYNLVFNHPITWIGSCFRAYKGSLIYHYNVNSQNPVGHIKGFRRSTGIANSNQYYGADNLSTGASNNVRANWLLKLNNGNAGMSVTNQSTQAGISVLYPMYSPFRMRTTDKNNITIGTSKDDTNLEAASIETLLHPASYTTQNGSTVIDFYPSIGTDFTLLFFLSVPTVYINPGVTPI